MSQKRIPPVPASLPEQRWFQILYDYVQSPTANAVYFTGLNFTGSNLTSLQTRLHDDLQSIQGAGTQHLSVQQVQILNSSQVMNWMN